MPESQPLVADLIVECLEREGVTHVFGIPGEENIHLVDALSRSSIRFVLVRHQQGASFMAKTYGRLTGKAGVCWPPSVPEPSTSSSVSQTDDQLDAPHRSFCAGRNESKLQGVPPGCRPGVDVCSGHKMVRPRGDARGATGDDQEGLQTRTDRAARRRVSRCPKTSRARWHQMAAGPLEVNVPRPDEPSPSQVARAASILKAASNPMVLAGHGAAARRRRTRPDAVRRDPRGLGGHDLPPQGRVSRRPPSGAGCDRIHAARLRELRIRPSRRDRHGRLRTPGVRPGADQPPR